MNLLANGLTFSLLATIVFAFATVADYYHINKHIRAVYTGRYWVRYVLITILISIVHSRMKDE